LSPDDESTELTTGGQGFQIESIHISDLDTGDVSEGFHEFDFLIGVHDQRSFFGLVSLVSEFALSGTESLAVDNFLHILECAESFQECDGLVGFFERFESVLNNQWHFGDIADFVASGLDEGGKGGGGQCGGYGVSSLFDVDFSVPSSVGFEGEAHSSLSDHIAECGLAGSRCTGA